jgi:hypothetical protein
MKFLIYNCGMRGAADLDRELSLSNERAWQNGRQSDMSRPDEFGPGSRPSTPNVPVDIIAKDLNDLADKLGACS